MKTKFRAWHKEQKRMFPVYGLGTDFITEDTYDGVNPGTNAFCGDDLNFIKVMQFTGAVDALGKEIYESDIFDHEGDGVYGTVIYNPKTYSWCIDWGGGDSNIDQFSDYHVDGFTVVGNIYEPPQFF